jgi:hypothetical protein
MGCEPDGLNINEEVGADVRALQARVLAKKPIWVLRWTAMVTA